MKKLFALALSVVAIPVFVQGASRETQENICNNSACMCSPCECDPCECDKIEACVCKCNPCACAEIGSCGQENCPHGSDDSKTNK